MHRKERGRPSSPASFLRQIRCNRYSAGKRRAAVILGARVLSRGLLDFAPIYHTTIGKTRRPLAPRQEVAQIDYGGVGARNIVGHRDGIICEQAEAAAVQDDGTHDRLLRRLQFADDLAQGD